MIFDHLENLHRYEALNDGFAKASAFLRREDLPELPDGRCEIDGENVYARILREDGRGRDEATLEGHRKYIDIQCCISGTDEMGWKPTAHCTGDGQGFDEANDLEFFSDKPDTWVTVPPGTFAIFFPSDAHAPMGGVGPLHKVVVKVADRPAD